MTLSNEKLEEIFNDFAEFVSAKDKEQFKIFSKSKYFDKAEKYKEEIYKDARDTIKNGRWKQEDVGTGKIHQTIISAIKDKVIYDYETFENNLINNWRLKDNFSKFNFSTKFEQLLFDFYKSKGLENEYVFDELLKYGHTYNLIAYLFFIKDSNQFLPISQQKFDKIFEELNITNFKTSGNASFENYKIFIDIVKQVRNFLKTKDNNVSLLDAHSFLWIVGNQMKSENFIPAKHIIGQKSEKSKITNPTNSNIEIENKLENLIVEEEDELSFPEGKEVFRLHKSKERNKELIKEAKFKHYQRDNKLCCQICNFSFIDNYGEIGEGFIEAHHLFPISKLTEETETKISDLALVCSNCHRMLHRRRPWLTLDELKQLCNFDYTKKNSSS